jgi:hypothetical protein
MIIIGFQMSAISSAYRDSSESFAFWAIISVVYDIFIFWFTLKIWISKGHYFSGKSG